MIFFLVGVCFVAVMLLVALVEQRGNEVGGTVITSTQRIDPMPVVTGEKEYPQGILEDMEKKGVDVLAVDALELAQQAGSQKAVNVVLMGAMAKRLGGDKELWLSAVERCVHPGEPR